MIRQQHEKNVHTCARILREKLSPRFGAEVPKVAIILGSGLGGLADRIQGPVSIPYEDLPGFPVLTVQGHAGEIIGGLLAGKPVIALKGRKHFYETDDADPLKTMIRSLKVLGVEILFISNAAGSLRENIPVGSLMAITDHINFMGLNPLTGPNDDIFGPRFPAMKDAYEPALRNTLKKAASAVGIALKEGVHMGFRGPSFETPAEIRMAQVLGADAVGMSTVPEVIVARHMGIPCFAISIITDLGVPGKIVKVTHQDVQEVASKAEPLMTSVMKQMVTEL